jgi:hypothetical protein
MSTTPTPLPRIDPGKEMVMDASLFGIRGIGTPGVSAVSAELEGGAR